MKSDVEIGSMFYGSCKYDGKSMMVKAFRVRSGWRGAVIKLQNTYTPARLFVPDFIKN